MWAVRKIKSRSRSLVAKANFNAPSPGAPSLTRDDNVFKAELMSTGLMRNGGFAVAPMFDDVANYFVANLLRGFE